MTERPDAVSAAVTARLTGEPVEDLSARTESAQVFANPDGTWTSEAASGPVRVVDDAGVWHVIDTDVVATADNEGLAARYASADVVFSAGGDKTFATVTDDQGNMSGFGWPTVLPKPVVDGNIVTYPGAVENGDLVVTALPTGFSHSVVLREAPTGPLELPIPLQTPEGELVEKANGSLVLKAAGKKVVTAPQPLMWDATEGHDGLPANVEPVETAVEASGSGAKEKQTLVLSPDEAWLSDPATQYPVTVDPSYTSYANGDSWVQNADYTTSQGGSSELRAGTYDAGGHKARSFVKFIGMLADNGGSGQDIVSATFKMRNWYSGSCTASAIRISRITETWSVPDLTWANQPTVTSTGSSTFSPAYGYSASCDADGYQAAWDATAIVQAWANGSSNWGIRIAADNEASNYTWRKYRSSEHSNPDTRPRMAVTYNSYPNTAGTPSVTTSPASSSGYSVLLTPTLRSTVADPNGGNVRGIFEVYQGATLKWTGTSAYVASGSSASVTVPAGTLAHGVAYSVKVRANDGSLSSKAYSASTAFTTDTAKPAVAITASAFTNGQWRQDTPSSNVFTLTGASDTASFAYTLDGVSKPRLSAGTGGAASLAWLPGKGSHKLTVTPTDKAGNVGSTATFTFGYGGASFLAPSSSTRSTAMFAVQVSGPPNATTAALSWRYSGQTAWHPVQGLADDGEPWLGTVTNASDGSASTSPALLWDATAQEDPASAAVPKAAIKAPALIELNACFTYAGTPSQVCSGPRKVQLVDNAFGPNLPVTAVGPAQVALLTGEMSLMETDATDTLAGVGRTFSSFDRSTTTPGPFGPGWSDTLLAPGESTAELLDHRAKDRTFVLVTAGGASQMFTTVDPGIDPTAPNGPVQFRPAGVDDGSRLTLDGATVTLTRAPSSETVWEQGEDGSWVLLEASNTPEEEPETTFTFDDDRFLTWIAETEPGAAATCTASVQETGCRGLKVNYTGTGDARRVSTIQRVVAGRPAVTLATYTYAAGRLGTVCSRDPDGAGAGKPLCSTYEYDTTTVAGRTLLKRFAPPGQVSWQFTYDASGRLTTVTRPLDEHSNDATGTPVTWTVSYDLATITAGLPDLSAASAAEWGQSTVPTKAYAVFSPDHIPAATPTSADLEHASLWFVDAVGAVTNTAIHGNVDGIGQWLVDSIWYENGNVVRTLDGAGRARALAAPAAERPSVAAEASAFTVYNDDGDDDPDDGDGTRAEDQFGPVRTATLRDGTTGPYRPHQSFTYDDEDPTLGGDNKPELPAGKTSFNLVVETTRSAADPDFGGAHDPTMVRLDYSPVAEGDGNGWTLGRPTRQRIRLDDGSWSTTVTRYDAAGAEIESRLPGGASDSSGVGSDAYATVTTYFAVDAVDGDCRANLASEQQRRAWIGLTCKVGPAVQPTDPSIPIVYYADYDEDLQPTRIEETSGSDTRVTTHTYDALGRSVATTVQAPGDTRTSTFEYDPESGLPTTQSAAGASVLTEYDSWGRAWKYTDASGMTSTTTFTVDDQIATVDDGAGNYSFVYDGNTGEHRGLATAVTVGGLIDGAAGTFSLTHDARGAQTSVTYPNGMSSRTTTNEAGVRTGLEYLDPDEQPILTFGATTDVRGRTIASSSDVSSQAYSFDDLGRLTQVQDSRAGECLTRTYGFTPASERKTFAAFAAAEDGTCQSATPSVQEISEYDTASRIRDDGYAYDGFGRTITIPKSDIGPGAVSALGVSYFANDMVESLTQDVDNGMGGTNQRRISYVLEPIDRIGSIINASNDVEGSRLRYRYSDDSDSPTSVQSSIDGGDTWTSTRYVTLPDLGMVASVSGTDTVFQLANLHGDIVATQNQTPDVPIAIDTYTESDEYGNPIESAHSSRYGWLGSHQRSSDTLGGLVLMGARLYNPSTGLFTSPDPIRNGGANPYAYPTDPINVWDPTGAGWADLGNLALVFLETALGTFCRTTGLAGFACAAGLGGLMGAAGYAFKVGFSSNKFNWNGLGMAASYGALAGVVGYIGPKFGNWVKSNAEKLIRGTNRAIDRMAKKLRKFAGKYGLRSLANRVTDFVVTVRYYVEYFFRIWLYE